ALAKRRLQRVLRHAAGALRNLHRSGTVFRDVRSFPSRHRAGHRATPRRFSTPGGGAASPFERIVSIMRRPTFLFLFGALTLAAQLRAADWPRFRGPNGSGVAETSA